LLALVLPLSSACSDDDGTIIADSGPVLGAIPWTVPPAETARYSLFDGDERIGSAVLSVDQEDSTTGTSAFSQDFEFPERDITDRVSVVAEEETLRPLSVTRRVDSPDGVRQWLARYEGSAVTVVQSDEDDERTDTLDVPVTSYDTWTDLFLWRTVDFRQGFEVEYSGVVTAEFAKPDVISIELRVTGMETVNVPAGTFEAWRMEIRSGGRTQRAWIADNEQRTLVRYDNTELVFELESD
jgi:hypothetical protein